MFCFGFKNENRIRETEQEYLGKVLDRMEKKGFHKPENFFLSMFKESSSRKCLFKPKELIKEKHELLSFFGVSCLELVFHESISRNEPEFNERRIASVGIPKIPLMPVTLWDERYYKLCQDKQEDLSFLHEIREINVEFLISDKSSFWCQDRDYEAPLFLQQESGYFLSVGLDESEFNKLWGLKSSPNIIVNTVFETFVYKEPEVGVFRHYIDFDGILGDNEPDVSERKSVSIELRSISINAFQEKRTYDESLSKLFESRYMSRLGI